MIFSSNCTVKHLSVGFRPNPLERSPGPYLELGDWTPGGEENREGGEKNGEERREEKGHPHFANRSPPLHASRPTI